MNKQETTADIIAEMNRVEVCADGEPCLRDYARRFEAAHKREIDALDQRRTELNAEVAAKDEVIKRLNDAIAEEQRRKMATTEKSLVVGDAAKLREALDEILEKIDKWRTDGTMEHWQYSQLFDIADAALAAPARNCDVGTMEEQSERFDAFCDAHKYVGDDGANWCSSTCPCNNAINCGVNWAQMPYDEGGAK